VLRDLEERKSPNQRKRAKFAPEGYSVSPIGVRCCELSNKKESLSHLTIKQGHEKIMGFLLHPNEKITIIALTP
jgi:hypothetical protein